MIWDYTHTKIDSEGLRLLKEVAKETKIQENVEKMFKGSKINNTEKRSVLHVALR